MDYTDVYCLSDLEEAYEAEEREEDEPEPPDNQPGPLAGGPTASRTGDKRSMTDTYQLTSEDLAAAYAPASDTDEIPQSRDESPQSRDEMPQTLDETTPEPDDIIAAEYRGLVLEGLTGPIQSDRDVEIILRRVRFHKRRVADIEARLETEVAAIRKTAEIEIAALTKNAEDVIKDNRDSLAWYERTYWPMMQAWLKAFLKEANTDKRSVKTLFGRIGLRAPGKPKTVIEDPAAALAWCKEHCADAIKMEILTSRLPDPKSVPGIKLVAGDERFEVETN